MKDSLCKSIIYYQYYALNTARACEAHIGVRKMVTVAVDLAKCNGDSVCAELCPTQVFEMKEVSGYDGKKSVVVNNDACIGCRACEVQCATQCITITD